MELSRRAFLKAGVTAAAALLVPQQAFSSVVRRKPRVKTLRFFNTHTEERVKVNYVDRGKYQPRALNAINHILRDHRTDEIHPIDTDLLDFLYDLQSHLGVRRPFHVISGYRSHATNAMLARERSGVASHSLHTIGQAIDIRMPGIRTRTLRDACIRMKGGGVGYYPQSDFVHVDIGRVRYW